MGSKKFWDTVKTFLTSKGFTHNKNTTIKIKDKSITNENKLTNTSNSHHNNIVKTNTEKRKSN